MNGGPLLPSLTVLDDPAPRPAPWNMAVDEALLATAGAPVLRFYRWERPAVSFGCFQPWTEVAARFPGRELVRRPTGGGAVEHGDGGETATYALVVPRAGGALAGLGERPAEAFRRVHAALAAALNSLGVTVEVYGATGIAAGLGGACFHDRPVPGDLVGGASGRKVAGAAQRRTRAGLLHQGSIRLPPGGCEAPGLVEVFAGALSPRPTGEPGLPPRVRTVADELNRTRYAQRAWTERR